MCLSESTLTSPPSSLLNAMKLSPRGTSSSNWRLRIGSSFVNSGGSVYTVSNLIYHPGFQIYVQNNVGIFRLSSRIVFGNNVQPGRFASANYIVADNQPVWTYGWGATSNNGPISNQLRHVQIYTVNQEICRSNYNILSMRVTETEMCAGNLEQGGRDPCQGDFGGALLHNGNVVGISSWGHVCGSRRYPAVYTRVPRFIDWIVANA
ncbi:trypsin, alkaline B-like [Melitaea cinxia]|uniref:trypsin, alkaline B-like n=1 Tax=Melitaea cinxia TaxID=113334 RepID=UPI001E2713F8|nr:trypsin, alkaline B-like [Melitaea cinxia]